MPCVVLALIKSTLKRRSDLECKSSECQPIRQKRWPNIRWG
ncbi:Uncharacterised protein [Vibrio cholerae]|nr:Uncharacterised protein [Vibrio cholerae]